MANETYMVMAGLWDEWTDKKTGERIKSCTIITCGEQCTSIRR
jgi:putative SOS response-associated peptidase YedK